MTKANKIRFGFLTGFLVLVGVLAGCSVQGDYQESGDFQVYQGVLPDGRMLVCVSAPGESGLSCDWDHAGMATEGS